MIKVDNFRFARPLHGKMIQPKNYEMVASNAFSAVDGKCDILYGISLII